MVPSGAPTEETVQAVAALLQPGDTVIDGGNTRFHDDVRRAGELEERTIHYIDAGTSGGIWGLKIGYCLMVGGERDAGQPTGADLHHAGPAERLGTCGGRGRRPLCQNGA